MTDYVELHCHSHYSLLDGASSPAALAQRAAELGLSALALTDHDALYSAVEFAQAAHSAGVKPIFGAELTLDGHHLTLLAETDRGYANLSRLISYARARCAKGEADLPAEMLADHTEGLIALSGCDRGEVASRLLAGDHRGAREAALALAARFAPGSFYVEVQRRRRSLADERLWRSLCSLADELALPVVATGNVHYAVPDRARLRDTLVAIRHNCSLDEALSQGLLDGNHQAYLRSPAEMEALFRERPDARRNAGLIGERCHASLDFAGARTPDYPLPPRHDANSYLRSLCEAGLHHRYPRTAARAQARRRMDQELTVIAETELAEYFLCVWDVVRWAREQGIRCHGRGSAASSIVAYLLDIVTVDPIEHGLLFARFLSIERFGADHAMPDIDLDFERDRREEVIQYVYRRYGWEHTAMACTYITYRARSAIRDVGKALGLSPKLTERVSKLLSRFGRSNLLETVLEALGPEATSAPLIRQLLELCYAIEGVPRHLSIHVGGMIVSRRPLVEMVPVEPARMEGRVVVQWDKDSIESAGLIKIDLLSLATLSAMSDCLRLIEAREGAAPDLQALPFTDPAVYDDLCRGDTVGVFQVESRAQQAVLPQMRPRCYRDLVIEVALIRPGPIKGGMNMRYLRRRAGEEAVTCPLPAMREALADTLGVIIFQEQVLLVAQAVAGFSPGEAELLRRAMGKKRSQEAMERLRGRFLEGAVARGASAEQAEAVFTQLLAFADYGFCRAHAAAFGQLAYQSAWLRHYHPLPYYVGLLNNQPLGFYAPPVVLEDAKRHGLTALPVDVNRSAAECTIEDGSIRIGLSYVRGMGPEACQSLLSARETAPFTNLEDLCRRVPLSRELVERLILAGACDGFGEPRRQLLWRLSRSLGGREAALSGQTGPMLDDLPHVDLPAMTEEEALVRQLAAGGLSAEASPARLYRRALIEAGAMTSTLLAVAPHGSWVRTGGEVIIRQRPPTAHGTCFVTLQDEHGTVSLVLAAEVYERHRADVRAAGLLVEGVVTRRRGAMQVQVERLWPLAPPLR